MRPRTTGRAMLLAEFGRSSYLDQIRRPPMLQPEQEYRLATNWRAQGDRAAAHELVTSHLRLVARIAMDFRGYGLPLADMIAEGNVGLMLALKRFDPEKGFRFATYASWWIKAQMQDYLLRSWSLVKMGSTAKQKRLFFNLRRSKRKIRAFEEGDLRPDQVALIAKELAVSAHDVIDMNRRQQGDLSLNTPLRNDDESSEWQNFLTDDAAVDQETRLIESEQADHRRMALDAALAELNGRERRILAARRLVDDPVKLIDLASEFKLSRERVRQLELRALDKVQQGVKARLLHT
jgi:RNA polymerase sigma-32 factor